MAQSSLSPIPPDARPTPAVSRRTLISAAAAAGVSAAIGGPAVLGMTRAFAAATASDEFLRLSEFLTGGKPLEAGLATRYQAALAQQDGQFAAAVTALQRFIAEAKPGHVDELLARSDLDDALRQTVRRIVSAWYLGVVGEGAKAQLISYANALMYRPTEGALVIPSYGGGPNSWGDKPALAADAAKPSAA